jgi:tRNA1Val (adenine37-N6)-methyltransferase
MKVGTDAVLLGSLIDVQGAASILDIGTGTGVLSLMLAQRSKAPINAIEIDRGACEDALFNFKNSAWKNRLHLEFISLQEFAKKSLSKYDLIVSNPPYFELNTKAEQTEARKQSRSRSSLSYQELIEGIELLLSPAGLAWIILPFEALEEIQKETAKTGLVVARSTVVRSFKYGSPVRIVLTLTRQPTDYEANELIIYEKPGKYTDGYIRLTSAYHAKDLAHR